MPTCCYTKLLRVAIFKHYVNLKALTCIQTLT